MTEEPLSFWRHAQNALSTARQNLQIDASAAENRAYYAAFYAVSALFAAEGKMFKRHAGIETAVHRDLVHTGRWSKDLGAAFSRLSPLRITADYDVSMFASLEEAQEAVQRAEMIVEAVRNTCPELE